MPARGGGGLGTSYATLSQDLSSVNFSSIRAGLIEEREEWKEGQIWLIENLLDPVFANWLEMGLTMGAIGTLPLSKFDKFNAPKWTGRRWAWVDPLEDVEVARAAVGAGFKSSTQVVTEMGGDLEDIYEEIKEETDLADSLGLALTSPSAGRGRRRTTRKARRQRSRCRRPGCPPTDRVRRTAKRKRQNKWRSDKRERIERTEKKRMEKAGHPPAFFFWR